MAAAKGKKGTKKGVVVQKHAKLKKRFSEDSLQNYTGKNRASTFHFLIITFCLTWPSEIILKGTDNGSKIDDFFDARSSKISSVNR